VIVNIQASRRQHHRRGGRISKLLPQLQTSLAGRGAGEGAPPTAR